MTWILVLLIVTSDGRLEAAQNDKPMAYDRCEAVGLAKAVQLKDEGNRSVQHLCVSLDGTKAPRKPVKNT